MKMKAISLIILIMLGVGFLSGCNEQENKSPTASVSANPISGEEPLTVRFTGSGSDSDGYISSYRWNFGDGHTSNQQNPSHTYSNHGSYSVTLTVTDDDGDSDTSSITIVVTEKPDPPNEPPTITSINANPTSGNDCGNGLNVHFTSSASDSDGIVSYHWDFGDGHTSNKQNPNNIFKSKDTEITNYDVILTVTDDDGDFVYRTKTIIVYMDTDCDDIPDYLDTDDDNDGFLDYEDLYPKKNAKIKIMLNKFKVWDEVDGYPDHLHAQIYFKIYINDVYRALSPDSDLDFWDVDIGEMKTINWFYIYDCDDDEEIHTIKISMYDVDGWWGDDLLDIDGIHTGYNNNALTLYYNITSGRWTGDDVDGETDGSDDGSQHTDEDDAYLEYDIITI